MSILNEVEVRHRREGGEIDAWVPMRLIKGDDVPVNDTHVNNLADLFDAVDEDTGRPMGQQVPILLAYLNDYPLFPIRDGFHRRAALEKKGATRASAIIYPLSGWEAVYRDRIKLALSHESVAFSRLFSWTLDMWKETKWAKMGFNLGQAMDAAVNVRKPILKEGLPEEELESMAQYFTESCQIWQSDARTVRSELRKAYGIDSRIVAQVRDSMTQPDGTLQRYPLTRDHLPVMGRLAFNYPVQELLVDVINRRQLTVKQTREFAEDLEFAANVDQAKRMITKKLNDIEQVARAREVYEAGLTTVNRVSYAAALTPLPRQTESSRPAVNHREVVTQPQTEPFTEAQRLKILYYRGLQRESAQTGQPIADLLVLEAKKYGQVDLVRADEVGEGPREKEVEDRVYEIQTLEGLLQVTPNRKKFVSPAPNAQNNLLLTPTEADLLEVLVRNPRKTHTHAEILTKVWGEAYEGESHLLRVNMARLREKLGDAGRERIIETIKGRGYKIATI